MPRHVPGTQTKHYPRVAKPEPPKVRDPRDVKYY